MVAILYSEAEHAGNMHKGLYWSLLSSLVGILPAVWPVKAQQVFSIFSCGGHFVQQSRMASDMHNYLGFSILRGESEKGLCVYK